MTKPNTEGRSEVVQQYAARFEFEHLPVSGPLKQVMETYQEQFTQLLELLPDGRLLYSALESLWDSKRTVWAGFLVREANA